MVIRLAGAALALTLLSSSAMAQLMLPNGQRASNVVTFGDSLSDRGNLFAITGFTTPPSPPYFNGAFSNGPVWTQLLAQSTPAAGTNLFVQPTITPGFNANYAIAGAETNSANPPGSLQQVAAFLARGGAASLGPNTVTTVLIGGNNLGNNLLIAAGSANPPAAITATALTAAGQTTQVVGQLVNAGARTIAVVNLPDLASTPRVGFFGAGAQQLGGVGTIAYNTALQSQMITLAAANPGANIITVDLYKAFSAIVASPGAFGFTNVTGCALGALGGQGCAGAPSANPNSFLFWDNFHPTAAGHAFLAALTADYLNYGNAAGAYVGISNTARAMRTEADTAVQSRQMNMAALARFGAPGALVTGRWNTSLDIEARSGDGGRGVSSTMVSGRAFFDRAFTNDIAGGVAISYSRADDKTGPVSYKADGYSLDAFVGWTAPTGLFANGRLGATVGNYADLRRQTLLVGQSASSSTRSFGLSAVAEVGYAFRVTPSFTLSPYASLKANYVTVDSIIERQAVTAALSIGSRTATIWSGDVAVRGDFAVAPGVVAHALVGWHQPFSRDGGAYNVSIIGNSARTLSINPRFRTDGSVLFGAGVFGQVSQSVDVSVEYRGLVNTQETRVQSHAGRGTVTFRF